MKKLFLISIICLFATLSNAHLLCFSEYLNKPGDIITIEELYDTMQQSYSTFSSSQKTEMQTSNRWVIELIEPLTIPKSFEQFGKTLWEVKVVGTTMAPAPFFDGNTQCGPEAHWTGINRPYWGDSAYTSYAWIKNK